MVREVDCEEMSNGPPKTRYFFYVMKCIWEAQDRISQVFLHLAGIL